MMKKNQVLIGVFAAFAMALAHAAEYSQMVVDVSALPKEKAFLRDLVLSRVRARTLPSSAGNTLNVRFSIDATLTGENALVSVSGGKAEVRGGRFRSLVFGAGVLLRAIRYGERTFSLEDGEYRFTAANPHRINYFARHFDNWYHRAGSDEQLRYVEDLALWGLNGFCTMLDYPVVDAAKATKGDVAEFSAVSVVLGERVRALDMDLMTFGGGNCAPEDMPPEYRAVPDKKPRGAQQFNVCPEKPGALDYLLSLLQGQLDRTKDLPVSSIIYFPFDEGGCACEKCAPWGGNGYVRLIGRQRRMNEKTFPGVKHLVSTWYFRDDDWEEFYRYLPKQDWIDLLIVGTPHTDVFPQYPIEHPLPKGIPMITFPEISMWGRFPWGGTGANPQPARFERIYRQYGKFVKGFMLYSEVIYEDVNKIIVNGLYVDPGRSAAETLAEYARYELPGCDPADFVSLCQKFEDAYETKHKKGLARSRFSSHRFTIYMAGKEEEGVDPVEFARRMEVAHEASRLADKIDAAILPMMRRNWRWRLLYLRAKIDESSFLARDAHNPTALAAYSELTGLYHCERQNAGLLDRTWRGYTCPPFADNDIWVHR